MKELVSKKIVAIIPARGGSQRLKNKNIYPLWGKPMIYWAINACYESAYIDEVWVSSEDVNVIQTSKKFNVKIHVRNHDLAENDVYKMAAIRNAAKYIEELDRGKIDIFISLQANSPQITSIILDKALETFENFKRNELISVDKNLMQNAAFRILRGSHVYQRELSTKCGAFKCDLIDVHTIDDVNYLETLR